METASLVVLVQDALLVKHQNACMVLSLVLTLIVGVSSLKGFHVITVGLNQREILMSKQVTLHDLLFAIKIGSKVVKPISPYGLGIGLKLKSKSR